MYITACSSEQIGGRTFERKSPVAITLFNKGGGLIFEGGPVIGRLNYILSEMDGFAI